MNVQFYLVNGGIECMKLEVISGQPNVELKDKFREILKQNGINHEGIEQKNFMIFPELTICQPKMLYDSIRERVCKDIDNDNDLFILTYSDHVLNAVRVEIKKHKFIGGKVHQFQRDGNDICTDITQDGKLTEWVKDIFDVWDRALYELIN